MFDLVYSYRCKTQAIFKQRETLIFDVFVVDDAKFDQYFIHQNLWRETLLL